MYQAEQFNNISQTVNNEDHNAEKPNTQNIKPVIVDGIQANTIMDKEKKIRNQFKFVDKIKLLNGGGIIITANTPHEVNTLLNINKNLPRR